MILEYTLVNENGSLRAPSWIRDGGYFHNPDNNTMIGYSPDEYSIPSSVIRLTTNQLIARALEINSRYPARTIEDPDNEIALTDNQITSYISDWVSMRTQGEVT